jgi:hypothetical protein
MHQIPLAIHRSSPFTRGNKTARNTQRQIGENGHDDDGVVVDVANSNLLLA